MSASFAPDKGDEWHPVTARIDACKGSWMALEDNPSSDYVVHFSYEVEGRVYRDWYESGSVQEEGTEFEILYDPANPQDNTGTDRILNPWVLWGARILGIGITLLAIWLWGDQEWFRGD